MKLNQQWKSVRAAPHLGTCYIWDNYVIQSYLDGASKQREDLFDVFKDDTGVAIYRAVSLSEAQLWVAFIVKTEAIWSALRTASGAICSLQEQIGQMSGMFSDSDGAIAQAMEDGDEALDAIKAALP